jgi:DNA mismatch endonuclease (patch repair protein)
MTTPVVPASWASSPAVRRNMQANRGRDTGPELQVRKILHRAGLRYRVNYPCPDMRRRTIDIAFPGRRVACFIDGCYWHQCDEHYVEPKTNTTFWRAKLAGNRRRDQETDASLVSAGWTVARFWEHEDSTLIASEISMILAQVDHPSVTRTSLANVLEVPLAETR